MLFDLLRLYQSTWLTLRWNKDCANTGLMFQWRFDNYRAISLLYFLLERCTSWTWDAQVCQRFWEKNLVIHFFQRVWNVKYVVTFLLICSSRQLINMNIVLISFILDIDIAFFIFPTGPIKNTVPALVNQMLFILVKFKSVLVLRIYVRFLNNYDNMIQTINFSNTTLVITSDHGNLEDVSVKTHTRNPVPLIAMGPSAYAFDAVRDLSGITPAILRGLHPTE